VTVSHLDLYRLEGLEHEDPALLCDYLGPGRIAFVEWPRAAGDGLSGVRLSVALVHRGADRRRIEVSER
jgi:tRNA A37 threonylcarbamoyladenosine biosynthesis protein TsaE